MAEIKKINGNTLCDETARVKADEAKTTADEAKSLAETAGEGVTDAKTAAEMAQRTADEAKTTADEAKTAADEAKTATESFESMVQGLNTEVSSLGEVVEEAQTTANKAEKNTNNLAFNLKGKAISAQYDATEGKLKIEQYSAEVLAPTIRNMGYSEMSGTAVAIWVGDRAYTIQSCKSYNNIVATCPGEDGLHILSGGFKGSLSSDCEFTETVVPYTEQVQADWSENDPESPAYIQNRIGGYKRSDAERLVEYDETTAEYIDVDVAGSGTAYRYRKASDTLVHPQDWVGGKTVIVIDVGGDEQETTLNIGTGESNAIVIVEKEFAAGKIWLTTMSGMYCGIIAPQETDLSASADGVSVLASGSETSGVVPKGVWILDMPYMTNLIYGGTATGYHKAVYCSGVAKIPEEYLETTTADKAKTTADEAKTTADKAKTTADKAKTTADEAKTTADKAKTTADEVKSGLTLNVMEIDENNISVDESADSFTKNGLKYYKWKNIAIEKVIECRIINSLGKIQEDIIEYPGCIMLGEDVMCVYRSGDLTADYTFNAPSIGVYVCYNEFYTARTEDVYIKYIYGISSLKLSGSDLTATDGKLLLDGSPVSTTYTAGDGIAIEDGVITADTASSATEATEFYLKSSTADSAKRFKITVTDDGTLTATEVV